MTTNRTKAYFDSATYEFIVRDDRKHFSYQPVSLFLNNIWDVPAPMRVIATGNSFWNIISSMRPHTLRNFCIALAAYGCTRGNGFLEYADYRGRWPPVLA